MNGFTLKQLEVMAQEKHVYFRSGKQPDYFLSVTEGFYRIMFKIGNHTYIEVVPGVLNIDFEIEFIGFAMKNGTALEIDNAQIEEIQKVFPDIFDRHMEKEYKDEYQKEKLLCETNLRNG